MYINQLPFGYKFGLPTEMQWEYACRADTHTKYYNGDDTLNLSKIAWHSDNSLGHPHPVGEKEPNAWGLYDMIGNVWEWCYDFVSPYPSEPAVNWVGNKNKSAGIFRGGDYLSSIDSGNFYCSTRGYSWVNAKAPLLGFRLGLRMTGLES
jgi:formylglycine-generating enzyme required for sulfatase activity